MDKKKCHFQWDSSNFSGILQGPNSNFWRERNYLPFAASCFSWRSISPAPIRMIRVFFLLVCGYCIPHPRRWHCFRWELPKEGPKRYLCPHLWSLFWYCSCFVNHLACNLHYAFPKVFQSPFNSFSLCLKSLGWVLGADVFADDSLSSFLGTLWCIVFFSGRNRNLVCVHEQATSSSEARMWVCVFAGARPKEL